MTVSTPSPQIPMVNLGNLYINGMQLSWTSTTVVTVQQGQARDSTNTTDIVLTYPPLNNGTSVTTPFTISTTVSGAGGVDTGTIAASTAYAVYAIWSTAFSQIRIPPSPEAYVTSPPYQTLSLTAPVSQSEGYLQANVLISTSAIGPVLPFGYDSWRYIGSVTTDSSSHFLQFAQTGGTSSRTVYLDVPVATSATAGSTSFVTIGTLAPYIPATAAAVILQVSLTPNAAGDVVSLQPYGASSSGVYAALSAEATGHAQVANLTVPIGLNAGVPQVNYETTSGSDVVAFKIQGYVDQL